MDDRDRDTLGRIVREAWVKWARLQSNPKPSWLLPYDDLSEADKEADRQIAEAVLGDMNARRIYLAKKKSQGEISEREADEFADLQGEYFGMLNRIWPMNPPDLERIEAIEKRLSEG